MAKNLSESSRPEKLVRMTSEDIRNRRWTEAERAALNRAAARQAAGIDPPPSDDFPPLTQDQLASMIRFRDRPRKVAVSVRLDSEVLDWLKSKGEGHLTRINDILHNLMDAEVQQAHKPGQA